MTRPTYRLAAACLAAGLLTTLAGIVPAQAAEEEEPEADPLLVTIDRLGPSTIPTRGRVTIGGVVTNASDTTWTDLQVYALTSVAPLTTEAELAAAAQLPTDEYIGDRLADPGQYVDLPDLAPGQSRRYLIRIPRSELNITGEQGVYWIGTHVLGQDDSGRIDGADGRTRTFIPLIREAGPPQTSLALLMPFRARIAYDEDGRLSAAGAWSIALSERGRFGRLLALSESASTFPLTWVVDPALVDLAEGLAEDNPAFDLGPTRRAAEPSPTDQPGTNPPEQAEDGDDGADEPERSPEALVAERWLSGFLAEAAGRAVLTLPYGDVDVAGAYNASAGDMVQRAHVLGVSTLESHGVLGHPVVDPGEGTLPWTALDGLPTGSPVVLSESAVDAPGPRVDVEEGPNLTLVDDDAREGVPGGARPQAALAMRQRILAEAAVHALSGSADQPLVVQLPGRWDPGPTWKRADFFEGLAVPWLTPSSASSVVRLRAADTTIEQDSPRLDYPEDTPEIPALNFLAAESLITTGETLDVLLPRNDTIGEDVAGHAYVGTSSQHRDLPDRAARRLLQQRQGLGAVMAEVRVTGPTFVTISSQDGPFQVTVTNGLEQPVTVAVQAVIGTDDVTIPPTRPITIPAEQRRSVRMQANSNRIGVWPIILEPVNADGTPLGQQAEMRIRSSQVGQYVWGVLGVGTLVLVVLIAVRVRRQVRARQATHGPVMERTEP